MSVLPRRKKHRFVLLGAEAPRYAPYFDGVTQYAQLADPLTFNYGESITIYATKPMQANATILSSVEGGISVSLGSGGLISFSGCSLFLNGVEITSDSTLWPESASSFKIVSESVSQQTISRIGARSDTISGFFDGGLLSISKGTFSWPMSQRNQAIQLPQPDGLGVELMLEPSNTSHTNWSYIDGVLTVTEVAAFIIRIVYSADLVAGESYLLEYEVVSANAAIRPRFGGGTIVNLTPSTTTGLQRVIGTAVDGNSFVGFQPTIDAASFTIKNISLKPLGTSNPLTIVNHTDAMWQEV